MTTSPSVNNYSVLKGKVFFTPDGGGERDLGNAPEIEFTPTVDTLEHFSSREGVRTKDREVTLEKSAELRIVLDEITAENLALMLLSSSVYTASGAQKEFTIMPDSEIKGVVRVEGTNDIGTKIDALFPSVTFRPTAGLGLISDEWGQIEITGEVLAVDGNFGTMTILEA